MLRNREQFEAITNSRAWAKLKAMPVVQMGMALYNLQATNPDSPPGRLQTALQDPEVQKDLSLLGNLVSDEVFVYGDKSMVDFVDLAQRLVGAMRYGPIIMQVSGKAHHVPPDRIQETVFLSALAENAQLLKAPDGVLGFKVHDAAAVKQGLQRLEKQVNTLLEENPTLKGRLKKTEVGGTQFLTFSLDGSMVPWDDASLDRFREIETTKGNVDKVVARLKQMTLVIAVGLRGDYLLVSIGSSTDVLTRLGQGKHLAERPELAPLQKFAGKRLTSVGYLSKAMSVRIASNNENIDQLLKMADALLPLANLPAGEREQIRKDAAELAADLKQVLPEPGAMLGLSFLTDRGIENYQYTWGDQWMLDGSKPLGLLQHVGGNPAIAAVNRGKVSVANYDRFVKWVGVGYRYFEKYAVPQMPEKERGPYQKAMTSLLPLFGRLNQTTRDKLLPALADGQIGLVIDTKLKSKQFFQEMPAAADPLPMLEPALIFGVSDAELLRQACTEYKDIFNAMIDVVRQIEGSEIRPDFRIPDAVVRVSKKNGYKLFTYPLPDKWGVDKQILPNAGLSDKVAVLTISRDHSRRLLAEKPPTVAGRSIPTDRPLAGAAMIDVAALVDLVTPWIDFGVHTAIERQSGGPGSQGKAAMILDQVHTVLDVLKVVRNVTVQTYMEGDALVSHAEIEIRDVAE